MTSKGLKEDQTYAVIFSGVEIDVIKILHLAHFPRHKMNWFDLSCGMLGNVTLLMLHEWWHHH